MKIKNKIKKKNNINLFNFFLKIYFYTSIILAIPIIILFFNTDIGQIIKINSLIDCIQALL